MSKVTVRSNAKSLTQSVVAGPNDEFNFFTDEPEKLGGENRGPTPYGLILSALGSCMSMTMILYAKRKSWLLEKIEIELFHSRIHANDCEECETKVGFLDRIQIRISIDDALDSEQKLRLLEIGQKCPVHRTLTKEVVIRTDLDGEVKNSVQAEV